VRKGNSYKSPEFALSALRGRTFPLRVKDIVQSPCEVKREMLILTHWESEITFMWLSKKIFW